MLASSTAVVMYTIADPESFPVSRQPSSAHWHPHGHTAAAGLRASK